MTDWKDATIHIDATLRVALRAMDEAGLKVLFIVSPNGNLEGILTDGDLRRLLIASSSLDASIKTGVNFSPLVAPQNAPKEFVFRMMSLNKIHQIPIVNNRNEMVGLHLLEDIVLSSSVDNHFFIMAGGKGKRLLPKTEKCPKPMLEVAGKPMIRHIIDRAVALGFRNFIISIGYLGEVIENYLGDGKDSGLSFQYIKETVPLGTGGSLSLLDGKTNFPIICTNGDVLAEINYLSLLEFHNKHESIATMAIKQYEMQNQFGVVHIDGITLRGLEEKPVYKSFINSGVYCLSKEAIGDLNYGEYCDMPELFEKLIAAKKQALVYPLYEAWMDVGRADDLKKANEIYER